MIKPLLFLTVCSFATAAQIPQQVKTEIEQRVKHDINPSIVVGFYQNGQAEYYTAGLNNKQHSSQVTANSVYEIGSITKTFTSLLLAQMVADKKLKLNDAIQDYWPQPFSLLDANQQPITFKQLATHTSGLPRLPNNMMPFAKDPYATYDRSMLIKAVNTTKPGPAGNDYAYSNFAVGLLGETLALVENQSFNDLVQQNILKPMQLKQTYMLLEQVPEELLVQGYNGKKASNAWNFKALAAAGSIRSSIQDLLMYGVNHLTFNPEGLKPAMQLAMKTHFQNNNSTVGLGWHINDGIYWHNGGTGGFRSILMIDPINNKVAAGITNHNNHDVEDIVAYLMDPSRSMRQHDYPETIADEKLATFTGHFKHVDSDKMIHITHENQQLLFNAKGQKNQQLNYIGEDTFKFGIMKIKVKFTQDSQGNVSALSLMGWGKPQVYNKLDQS